jgi:hypothetical protein
MGAVDDSVAVAVGGTSTLRLLAVMGSLDGRKGLANG